MQKPTTETLQEAVRSFGEKWLINAPEDIRPRVEYQVFRMLTDLPEEDWEKQEEVELDLVCALFAQQVVKYIITARGITQLLRGFGLDVPDEVGQLPSETYPDRNFYEVIEEVVAEAREKGYDTGEASPLTGAFPPPPGVGVREDEDKLTDLDFSGGFSA